ncbi:MAG TPA: iron-containing redox enzyme family protein [Streptosporangiaceae bacterium]|nr:iron-containing redox enzyme family protein [Streptosporangiaceae bacterium]
MAARQAIPFEPPDTIAALPVRPFEFSASASDEADAIVAGPPDALFRRLLGDQESEAVWLVARRVLDAFLTGPGPAPAHDASVDEIAAHVAGVRDELAAVIERLGDIDADGRAAVLAQRAPLGLITGCWLDVLSQPATQPSVIVNRLFAHHFELRGKANPRRSVHYLRRQSLEQQGVFLPETSAADFLDAVQARPLTALHGSFYLALSRLPANFLPELVGVHYAVLALGVDDLLLGLAPMLAEVDLRDVLAAYLELAGPSELARLHAGLGCALELEREHVAMLAELAAWQRDLPLESKVAAVIARHAPFAGRHHKNIKVGDRPLAETFADPELDLAGFMADFRESKQLRPTPDGLSAFGRAIKFGGPMFGIFSEREAATFADWVASVQAGERPAIEVVTNTVGDAAAAARSAAVRASRPADVVIASVGAISDREFFHRLVNIENFANTLPLARQQAERLFQAGEILFSRGAGGRYTDASYFDYSAEALYERAERVYWDKLVAPYKPLDEIPDRDEVVFLQTTYALGALVDATWIHRTANIGRCDRRCDAALFSIYADEVGYGDLRKNHITLIHQALRSMDVLLPHIRDEAFMEQGDLPDALYGFSLHQLRMALFPDTYYNEILGYNLAIEMFGLGELRLHEIQKLNHYGFDDCYEQAHLTIDNISAGHSRQAADIIVAHLDEVRRVLGDAAVEREWRRVWRGYASLAYFVEHALLRQVQAEASTAGGPGGSSPLASTAGGVGGSSPLASTDDDESMSLVI